MGCDARRGVAIAHVDERTGVRTVVIALVAVLLGAGCAAPSPPAPGRPESATPVAGDGGTGKAWLPVLQQAARDAQTPLGRAVLADGSITAAEVAALQTQFVTCMSGRGYDVTWVPDAESFDVKSGKLNVEAQNDAVKACEGATDEQLVALYYQMRRNPGNEDELTLVARCLSQHGVVPKGFSAADLRRDLSGGTRPGYLTSAPGEACQRDPLGSGS